MQQRQETLLFIDVMARGYYPSYSGGLLRRRGVELHTQLGDAEILAAGTKGMVPWSEKRKNRMTG